MRIDINDVSINIGYDNTAAGLLHNLRKKTYFFLTLHQCLGLQEYGILAFLQEEHKTAGNNQQESENHQQPVIKPRKGRIYPVKPTRIENMNQKKLISQKRPAEKVVRFALVINCGKACIFHPDPAAPGKTQRNNFFFRKLL